MVNVEYSNARQSLLITRTDGTTYWIDAQSSRGSQLRNILEGITILPEEELKAILKWYKISLWRYGYEDEKLQEQLEEETDSNKRLILAAQSEALAEDFKRRLEEIKTKYGSNAPLYSTLEFALNP